MSLLPVASSRITWREIWRVSRGHRARLLAVVVLGLTSAGIGLISPAAVGYLVDEVQAGTADGSTVLIMLALMAGAAFVGAVGMALTIMLAGRSYHSMLATLREHLMERALQLPQGVVERAGTGDLVSRSSDDVAQVADAAPQIIPAFTTTGFTIVVTLVGMSALDWWYGLALVVVLPVYVVTLRWYLRTGPRIYRAERSAMSGRAQQLMESQRGYATVLGFGLGEQRHQRVLDASWSVVAHSLRARTVQNMFFGRLNLAEYLGMAAILLTGFWLIDAGQSTVGAATTAMLLFLRLFGPINQLLFVVDVLQSVLASLNRIVGVITASGTGTENSGNTENTEHTHDDAEPSATAVDLSGVRFAYDDAPVLHDISLRVRAGERIAVVGASGAGKTTLAAVIAGIHPPAAGTITVPQRTAVVSQEVHVFSGTLRENLTLAAPDASDQDLGAALAATGSLNLVDRLPEGLDTIVGTGGHELTAAEAQQLALVRLVLADPELAILDEATAEAGSSHAELLDEAARRALDGRTGIVIAHRLTQAAVCDRVIVMDQGRIVEQGTHEELLTAHGIYARLWDAWSVGRVSPGQHPRRARPAHPVVAPPDDVRPWKEIGPSSPLSPRDAKGPPG